VENNRFAVVRMFDAVASLVRGRTPDEHENDFAENEARAAYQDLACEVEQARQDWIAARAYFEAVSDPELVDHAIHLVLASEKRYAYLLKEVKETYARANEA